MGRQDACIVPWLMLEYLGPAPLLMRQACGILHMLPLGNVGDMSVTFAGPKVKRFRLACRNPM